MILCLRRPSHHSGLPALLATVSLVRSHADSASIDGGQRATLRRRSSLLDCPQEGLAGECEAHLGRADVAQGIGDVPGHSQEVPKFPRISDRCTFKASKKSE